MSGSDAELTDSYRPILTVIDDSDRHFFRLLFATQMGSYPIDDHRIIDACQLGTNDDQLQKPHIYNKYLPFHDLLEQQGLESFNEIRENLSRTIQSTILEPDFSFWSTKLQRFISLYGFYFTKIDHLKLIHFYLSILTISDLSFSNVKICFDVLCDLMRKTRLITRDDLVIDWRFFHRWAKFIYNNHDKTHGLITLPHDIEYSLIFCVRYCSPYFSPTATREILDEFRPQFCATDFQFSIDTIKMFEIFLPVILPPKLHHQGFKLWLNEFLDIWEHLYNGKVWDLRLMNIFSSVAWNNMGHIDWTPWLSRIFTRILRGFSLPIGEMQISCNIFSHIVFYVAKWIVAMISDENSCLVYLKELLMAMKSFYHPSNTGSFQENLVEFILKLSECFLDRVHLERKDPKVWYFTSTKSSRLTEQNITDFVEYIKDYAFISIFNKNHGKEATEACQYLSILRPELIIPMIVDKLFSSIDNITEPHRFTSIMHCLTCITRQMVQYPQGQTYVIPLLISVLPGIDLNDVKKTIVTLDFYNAIFKLIICVDCSSAIHTRNDLTDIEKQVCLSTVEFENFIIQFLHRIFRMIEILSTDVSDDAPTSNDDNTDEKPIEQKVISILYNITRQCSEQIFRIIREKIIDFLACAFLSAKVRKFAAGLIRALVRNNPEEILEYILPKTCQAIENIMNNSESNALLTDDKDDMELNWYLILFSELVDARGDVLLNYKQMIMSIFHRCIPIVNKYAYEAIGYAATCLLVSLLHVYPINNRIHIDESLPIRAWGNDVGVDQVQFHLPNSSEIQFACEFIETFIYPELTLLNENALKLSIGQRLRSLTIIYSIAIGCSNMIPLIDSEKIQEIAIASDSKYRIQYSIYGNEAKFRENLRMRLLIDIGKFLDILVENHSDDVKSINIALKIYSSSSIHYGVSQDYVNRLRRDIQSDKKLFKNKLNGKQHNLRFLSIDRIVLQMKRFELNHFRTLSEIDRQVIFKLFDFSINQYSEVRRKAQYELFAVLNHYTCSYQVIIDRIVELLNTSNELDHHRIKGCLYILLGNSSFFLPTKQSWSMMEKLWPSIAMINPVKKNSTQNLIDNINKKIVRDFVMQAFIQNTNEISRCAAADLYLPLKIISNGPKSTHIQSYNNLMNTLNTLLKRETATWKQQKTLISFLSLLLQKNVPIPSSCIQTFVDFLIHDNTEIRNYAAKCIAALCRLQKPARIFREKSFGSPVICSPGDRDDNVWVTIDDYQPPKTQLEWEQTCFLDKVYHGYYTWPQTIKYAVNKRIHYTQDTMPEEVTILYDRFIDKNYIQRFIQLIILDDDWKFHENIVRIFKGLFRNFGLLFFDHFIEQVYELIHDKTIEKQKGSHRIAAQIIAGIIRGSKYWTLDMLNELWTKLSPLLTEIFANLTTETRYYWYLCMDSSMKNIDPRRIYRLIDFLRTLIKNEIMTNTFNETSLWYLVQSLTNFQWRIPSLWLDINQQAKELLDHSSQSVRDCISSFLSRSFSFNLTFANGMSIRQPNIDHFIDEIDQRLREAIEVCEKSSLAIELDSEACKALNFIESVIEMIISYFYWSGQPMKDGIVRLFPYLCEIESLGANNQVFKNRLKYSRVNIGMNYFHTHFFDGIIQQLEQVYQSSKWHVRRAAISFVQNMVFSNLFNVRPYTKRLHTFVLKCLFDEQIEVRMVASTTLSGFYQCGYIQVIDDDLKYFREMSKTKYFTIIDGKKVTSTKNIVQRHGGVLGLCAIVRSSPYDISTHLPDALMLLCEHSYDPNLIQKSVQQCLADFHHTHYDSWHEHQKNFTDDQLLILNDAFISHSYYT